MALYLKKTARAAGVAAIGLLLFHPSAARADGAAAEAANNAAGIIWQAGNDIFQQQINGAANTYGRDTGRGYGERGDDRRGYDRGDDNGGDDHGADRRDDRGGDRGGDDNGGGDRGGGDD